MFVDPGRGDFAIQGTSPLVDRGNPALVAGGELDLAGSPRSLDGNRDCIAVPDIGAQEVTGQGVGMRPFPTISGFSVTNKCLRAQGREKGQTERNRAHLGPPQTGEAGNQVLLHAVGGGEGFDIDRAKADPKRQEGQIHQR